MGGLGVVANNIGILDLTSPALKFCYSVKGASGYEKHCTTPSQPRVKDDPLSVE